MPYSCVATLSESRVLTISRASGKVIALAETWSQTVLTFCRTGPQQGVAGPGITRIGCILDNRVTAPAAVQSFHSKSGLVVADHLPLEVQLDVSIFSVADTVALNHAEN